MWTPFDILFIAWYCNFSPCDGARLKASEVIDQQENRLILESVKLRNDF
jgi:hypothetical protein